MTPWFEVPITAGETYAHQSESTDDLPVGGLYLPAVIERRVLREVEERLQAADRAALQARLAEEALEAARTQLPRNARERLCWTEVSEAEGAMRVRAVVEAEMDIAIQNGT